MEIPLLACFATNGMFVCLVRVINETTVMETERSCLDNARLEPWTSKNGVDRFHNFTRL
jgi:hypothetical protein